MDCIYYLIQPHPGAAGVGLPAAWIAGTGIHARDVRARGLDAVTTGCYGLGSDGLGSETRVNGTRERLPKVS